jgi:hypothetical protein
MLPTEAPTRVPPPISRSEPDHPVPDPLALYGGVPYQDRGRFVQIKTAHDTSPYSNPSPEPLVPGDFEILHRNIALSCPNGRGLVLYGDVARLSSGELRCRYPTKGVDGNFVTYDRWHPDDNIERVVRPHGYDWAAWARTKRQTIAQAWELVPRTEPPDLLKFRREYPTVAKMQKIDVAAVVTRVFEIGKVFVSGGFGPDFWHSVIDRHASEADFGANGQFAGSAPLTDETFWTLETASILVQNAAAIQSQTGAVQSRYRLEGEYERMCKRHDMVNVANVTTVFSRSGSTTVAWCEEFHPEQHPL